MASECARGPKNFVKQEPGKVIAKTTKAYGEKLEKILRGGWKRFEARDVAIYLLKRE